VSADWGALQEGEERSFHVDAIGRFHFVRYAGASGDFNPIHFDEDAAKAAGVEGVFGQGMFTAGVLSRIVSEWFGPESIRRYTVRFRARLWPGDSIHCTGRVQRVYQEDGVPHADLLLSARSGRGEVLIRGGATVRRWDPPVPG
jgi:peroxisomal enoyl-CoA hydratase 2